VLPWRSIEFRLAAWYSLLLFAGIAFLGGALWVGLDYSFTASVDDLLAERVAKLVDFVKSEFGTGDSAPASSDGETAIRGVVREVQPQALLIGDTQVILTPQTIVESDFGARRLAVGQYVDVELSPRGGQWIAEVVTLETDGETELREEIVEYLRSTPEGQWTHLRTAGGAALLPLAPQGPASWLNHSAGKVAETVSSPAGIYRILQQDVRLAGSDYRIQMASSLAAIVSAKRRLLMNLAWAVPLVMIVSLGGGYHVARSALQPIESVVAVAQGMDVGKLSERLDAPSSGDVVERLAKTFNGMLDRLEGSVRRLEEFTADASHELRSPVAVIRTTAELALRHDRTSTQLRSDMQEIESEAARLTSLIENLLTLARSDANGTTPRKHQVDLCALAVEVGEQHRRLHPSRALAVEIPSQYAYVLGDEASLRQLLAILLDNAVRHTSDEASITIGVTTEGDAHRLSVADTGKGIPPSELGRIFDRFYRGDSSRGVDGGFGLGLSIARWIAKSHGACIEVESIVSQGSVFSVSLSASPTDLG